jgi:hypothetical protein
MYLSRAAKPRPKLRITCLETKISEAADVSGEIVRPTVPLPISAELWAYAHRVSTVAEAYLGVQTQPSRVSSYFPFVKHFEAMKLDFALSEYLASYCKHRSDQIFKRDFCSLVSDQCNLLS